MTTVTRAADCELQPAQSAAASNTSAATTIPGSRTRPFNSVVIGTVDRLLARDEFTATTEGALQRCRRVFACGWRWLQVSEARRLGKLGRIALPASNAWFQSLHPSGRNRCH